MKICNQCWINKSFDEFYKHPLTKLWVMWRCKICVLNWRKTEHEKMLSKVREKKRYEENPRRRLYTTWRNMNARCYDPSNSRFKTYWGRWIKVEWIWFDDFYNDVIDSYLKHTQLYWKDRKNCQIDRIDNNWNYSKSNFRFLTCEQNQNNRSNNVYIKDWNQIISIMQYCKEKWGNYKYRYTKFKRKNKILKNNENT